MTTDETLRKVLQDNPGELSHEISFFHEDGSVKSIKELFDEMADMMRDEYVGRRSYIENLEGVEGYEI